MKIVSGNTNRILILDNCDFLARKAAFRMHAPEEYEFDENDLRPDALAEFSKHEIVLLVSETLLVNSNTPYEFLEVAKDESAASVEVYTSLPWKTNRYGINGNNMMPGMIGNSRLVIDKEQFDRLCLCYMRLRLSSSAAWSCNVEVIERQCIPASFSYGGSASDFSNIVLSNFLCYSAVTNKNSEIKRAGLVASFDTGGISLKNMPNKDEQTIREMEFFLTKSTKPSSVWDD